MPFVSISKSAKSLITMALVFAFLLSPFVGPSSAGRPTSTRSNKGGSSDRQPVSPAAQPNQARVKNALGKLPISFEANVGQLDKSVKFLSRGSGYRLFLNSTEAVLTLTNPAPRPSREKLDDQPTKTRVTHGPSAAVRMKLIGANSKPKIQGLNPLSGKVNYFTGNDPRQWKAGIPNYTEVKYESVYPGVDMIYYGHQGQLEYDFRLAPDKECAAIEF